MTFDKSKFAVKNVKYFNTMDGGGFTADLFYKNKKIIAVQDLGYGGGMDFQGYTKEIYAEVINWCSKQPPMAFSWYDDEELDFTLSNFVEELLHHKEKERIRKKMQKSFLKGICYGTEGSFTVLSWKNKTLGQMIEHHPDAVKKAILELKRDGENILNDNISEELMS